MTPLHTKLSRFPPLVCRLLARTGPKNKQSPLSDTVIAKCSGMTVSKVASLSWLTSWDDVTCSDMLAFSRGCGVNFSNAKVMRNHTKYMVLVTRFVYLRRHKDWHTRWSPMLEIYKEHLREKYRK